MKSVAQYLVGKSFLDEDKSFDFDSYFTSKVAKAGEYVIKQGEICRKMIFLQEGIFYMLYERGNKSFIKDFIFKNDFASVYESFITQKPANYSLKALTDCTYQSISHHDFQKSLRVIPELSRVQNTFTVGAYLNVTQRLESLITLSAEERYLELLKRRPTMLADIPLYHIASYLGITDVALSRIRKKITKSSS